MFRRSILGPILSGNKERGGFSLETAHLPDATVSGVFEPREFVLPTGQDSRLTVLNDRGGFAAELLRTLATRLKLIQKRHAIKKLLVTSAVPGEGKTVISANLAVTLALHLKRVLLIDGDLRSANLSRWFGIAEEQWSEIWQGDGINRQRLLLKAQDLPLWVIPAGKPVEMPGKILQTSEFGDALSALEADFDWIVMDSPPLVPFGDATVLASLADATVLVTRRDVTPKAALRDALKVLDKSKIIATVFNCANVTSRRYYQEYYAQAGILPAASGEEPQLRITTIKE